MLGATGGVLWLHAATANGNRCPCTHRRPGLACAIYAELMRVRQPGMVMAPLSPLSSRRAQPPWCQDVCSRTACSYVWADSCISAASHVPAGGVRCQRLSWHFEPAGLERPKAWPSRHGLAAVHACTLPPQPGGACLKNPGLPCHCFCLQSLGAQAHSAPVSPPSQLCLPSAGAIL